MTENDTNNCHNPETANVIKDSKDILEKMLLSYADVFADCENALTFEGRIQLKAEDIQPAPTESFYRGVKRMHNQFTDISFFRMENGNIRAQYIIGNETKIKRRQVLRKASYQGGAYRAQLDSKKPAYPVICMVLDWTKKRSRLPISLQELLKRDGAAPEELKHTDEMKLTVYHMRNLSAQIRNRFTSDMGFVVDFLNEGNFDRRLQQKIIHIEALCEMMEALTGDVRFTALTEELINKQTQRKEKLIMCEYLDMLEARGQAKGEKIGEARGEKIGEARGEKIGEARGEKIGEARGKSLGENRLSQLIQLLLKENKLEDIAQATSDSRRRTELYQGYFSRDGEIRHDGQGLL